MELIDWTRFTNQHEYLLTSGVRIAGTHGSYIYENTTKTIADQAAGPRKECKEIIGREMAERKNWAQNSNFGRVSFQPNCWQKMNLLATVLTQTNSFLLFWPGFNQK